jgi:hypothetical protein
VDDEADATDSAEMMDLLLEQYLAQGGDAVLEALAPDPDAPIGRGTGSTMARTEAECGLCHALTAVGSIANDPPVWSADLGVWTIERGILCGVCDRVTLWRESCSAEGMPSGLIVPHPPPRVLSGPEAGEWLRTHESVCRVLCAQWFRSGWTRTNWLGALASPRAPSACGRPVDHFRKLGTFQSSRKFLA